MAAGTSAVAGSTSEYSSRRPSLSELAGELKVVEKMFGGLFCRSTGEAEKAEIYTGNPEFKTVEREIKVIWL